MLTHRFPTNGKEITLSGDQMWFIRSSLGLSQAEMAARLAVTQPSVFRLERRGPTTGPEVILIDSMAKTWGISVPDDPINREDPDVVSAVNANLERIKQGAAAADDVRGILGSGTTLTYAAEWPDYAAHRAINSR